MNLFQTFAHLLQSWRPVFPQDRTFVRAQRLALALLLCLRSHLTSSAICASGRQFQDWSADYRLFSRSHWEARDLFNTVLDHLQPLLPPAPAPLLVALDDTLCKKTGRRIPGATIARDPQSLPYHVNLCRGLRFVQASVLIPSAGPARALPVRFELAPPAAKPKKNATAEQVAAYRQEKKRRALPQVGVETLASVRAAMDERDDLRERRLVAAVDGSYTNRGVLPKLPPRTVLIGRIRKDAKLCQPLPEGAGSRGQGRPKRYGPPAPTPQEVLADESIPLQRVTCFAAGQIREMPVKVYGPVYWRKAGADMPLLLIVVKPLGYRLRQGSKLLYREPAFLICTDPAMRLQEIVQDYVYRWEIEVNHRDEKSLLGVAQGQVWNANAVPRLPAFQVAGYSLLVLASLLTYGAQRTADYLPLPKWRGKSQRPSLLDIVNLLRHQMFAYAWEEGRRVIEQVEVAPMSATKSVKIPPLAERLCTMAA